MGLKYFLWQKWAHFLIISWCLFRQYAIHFSPSVFHVVSISAYEFARMRWMEELKRTTKFGIGGGTSGRVAWAPYLDDSPEISARRSLSRERAKLSDARPTTGREGQKCRPLDHKWQIPFLRRSSSSLPTENYASFDGIYIELLMTFLVQMVRLGCLVVEKTHAYFLDNSVTYSTCTCRVRIINYPVPISSPPFKIAVTSPPKCHVKTKTKTGNEEVWFSLFCEWVFLELKPETV